MRNLRMAVLLFFASFLIIVLDQILKYIMLQVLVYGDSISIIRNFFSLTLVFNTGAAFGILQGQKYIFLILPVLTVVLILIIYIRSNNKINLLLPMALLLGGTIGNFIDRIKYGYVIDFFDVFFRSWHWPAFNIADTCICLGVIFIFPKIIDPKSGFDKKTQ